MLALASTVYEMAWCLKEIIDYLHPWWLHSLTSQRTLRWRHNGQDDVSNHQPHHCLLNCLFGRRSKKTSKLRVTGLCAGNSPGTGEFPAQMASNAENVSIWWRHHEFGVLKPTVGGRHTQNHKNIHMHAIWTDFEGQSPSSTNYIQDKDEMHAKDMCRKYWLMPEYFIALCNNLFAIRSLIISNNLLVVTT